MMIIIEKNSAARAPLLEAVHKNTVTLLFAARQPEMNQVVDFLARRAAR